MKPCKYITIGHAYAKDMHYAHLVGCTAIVLDEMPSVAEVMVIGGEHRHIGQTADIHITDCHVENKDLGSLYRGLINHTNGRIYYTEDRRLFNHVVQHFHFHETDTFRLVSFIHEVLDECMENHPDKEWSVHHLDNENDRHLMQFHRAYREKHGGWTAAQ